jgi:hypothetical protein
MNNRDYSMSSSDNELMDDFHVTIGNANAVAFELDSTIFKFLCGAPIANADHPSQTKTRTETVTTSSTS